MKGPIYIQPFDMEEFSFDGAWYYHNEKNAVLISRSGTTMKMSCELAQKTARGQLPEDLAFKLYQRGFGRVYGKHRFNEQNEQDLPRFFMIDFTTKCNCNCIYCLRHFEDEGKAVDGAVLEDICRYLIDYCDRHDIRSIAFQPWGGEPLIELEKILRAKESFEQAGIRAEFSLQTNGLLLTEENYRALKEAGIGIGVSIDGAEESHDAHRVDVRGEATHRQIRKRIEKIRQIDPEANLGTISVNSRFTAPHIRENIAYLAETLGFSRLKFNLVHPNGEDFDHSMLITEEEIPNYVESVLSGIIQQVKTGRFCTETNLMDKSMNLLCRPDDDLCHSRGCRGGHAFISFSQEGGIYPCEMIGSEENCLGSIYEGVDLAELIAAGKSRIPYFYEREQDECRECPWQFYCRGGCKASAMAYGKAPREIDDIECAVNKALYPKLIRLLLEEPETLQMLADDRVIL